MLDLMVREINGVFRPLQGTVNPGCDLQSVDVLYDSPGLVTVAALEYSNGTMYEVAVTDSVEAEDFQTLSPHIPNGAIWISSRETGTHGNNTEWEMTHCLWLATPPAE